MVQENMLGCLTPRRRPSSTEEIPFFAVTIRWTAANSAACQRQPWWRWIRLVNPFSWSDVSLLAPVALVERCPARTAHNARDGRRRGIDESRPAVRQPGQSPDSAAPAPRRRRSSLKRLLSPSTRAPADAILNHHIRQPPFVRNALPRTYAFQQAGVSPAFSSVVSP